MIEIIVLIFVGSSISRKAKAKGYTGWPFGLLAAALWIIFEIVGVTIAVFIAIALEWDVGIGIWLLVILLGYGAAASSIAVSNAIVKRLQPKDSRAVPGVSLRCAKCGATIFLQDDKCRFCGAPASVERDREILMFELRKGAASPQERSRYVIRLAELGHQILPELMELYRKEAMLPAQSPLIRATLAAAIYKIEGNRFLPEIEKLAKDPFPVVRETALKILAKGRQNSRGY